MKKEVPIYDGKCKDLHGCREPERQRLRGLDPHHDEGGRASASFYFALVNLTKECKISLVKCQMA